MNKLAYTLAIAALMSAAPAIGSEPVAPPAAQAAPAPEQPAEAAPAQAAAKPTARVVCKNEVTIGSRRSKKVCRTEEAAGDVRRVGRDIMEHGQRELQAIPASSGG